MRVAVIVLIIFGLILLVSSNGIANKSKINFKFIGQRISDIISVSVPVGSQRVAVFILSNDYGIQEASTKVIKSVSQRKNKPMRAVFIGTKPFNFPNKQDRFKATFNLIFTNDLSLREFSPFLTGNSPYKLFNHKVETIFLVIENEPLRLQLLENVMKYLLYMNLLNFILIHIDLNSQQVRSFNHFPFSTGSKIMEIDIINKKFTEADLDRDSNINGHVINLVQYDDPPKTLAIPTDSLRGYEGMLMRVVMEKMNATPHVHRLPCSDQFVKLSTLQLTNASGDLTVNTQFILSSTYENSSIDFLYPQILDSLNLLVHLKINNRWNYVSVFKPFQVEIWIALIGSLLIVTIIWYIIKVVVFKESITLGHVAMSVVGLLVQPIQSNTERFLVTGYIMFMFIIMSGYQTVLISILTSPSSNTYLTLSEVNTSSQIDIVMPAKYELSKEFIKEYLQKIISNKFKVVRMNFWDLSKIERNENHVYLVHVRDGGHFTRTVANRDQNGQLMFKMLPEGLWHSMDTYAMKKNFVLEKRITNLVEGIRQARLLERYIPEALFEARQLGILSMEPKGIFDKPKVVTFESLKSAFTVLLVGYILSFTAFICEIRNPSDL